MRKLGSIESDLSKKKMDQFSNDMKKYSKLGRSSLKHAAIIDDMFYRNFKIELVRNRAETSAEHSHRNINRKKKLKKQILEMLDRPKDDSEDK